MKESVSKRHNEGGREEEEGRKRTQSDIGVPSSANWNPTNPFARRIQKMEQMKPTWTAVNHCEHREKKVKGPRKMGRQGQSQFIATSGASSCCLSAERRGRRREGREYEQGRQRALLG